MQYGPDFTPVSGKTLLVGPPVQGPTPVPVFTTVTVIGGQMLIDNIRRIQP
mgnify:CR=1 FL=1